MKTFKQFSKYSSLETVFGSHSNLNEELNFKPAKRDILTLHDKNQIKDSSGSIKNYASYSAPINSALHKHHNGEKADNDSLDKARKITKILSNHKLGEHSTLFTGLRRNPSHLFKNKSKPIKVHLPAFTSTSNSLTEACGFAKEGSHADSEGHKLKTPETTKEGHSNTRHVLLLDTPKGTEGGSVRHHAEFSNEHEVLLNRGMHVEIHHEPTTFIHPRIFGNTSSNQHFTLWHGKVVGNEKNKL